MSLTEIVFEIGDRQYPLCEFTRHNPGTRGVYRVMETGAASGFFRAAFTILGPTETTNAFLKEMSASKRYDEMEVLSITPYAIVFRVGHRIPEARAVAGTGVQPIERMLSIFGEDTIIEPILVESGRMRVRCLIPQPLDTKRVLVRLQELQRAMSWEHFRVVRVAEFKARQFADTLRRLLSTDQEEILRLALTLGYYDSPKRCTLGDIAKRVGLSVSPVHKKLKEIEQILINAHVDPANVAPPEHRRPSRALLALVAPASPGSMTEVALRIRWKSYPALAFTAAHPGSRVVLQPLVDDVRSGTATALVVAVASESDYRTLLASLEAKSGVLSAEVTSRDSDHVSVKLKTTLATSDTWTTHAQPFTHLLRRFGRDAYLRPVVVDGDDLWLRFIVVRGLGEPEILSRLEQASKEAGWSDYEVLSLRRVEVDPAASSVPAPEKMTPRQEEVLKIAHALGYYKTPRECTLEDVANTLGISANAIHKNLTAAEEKLICAYLSTGV